MMNTFRLCCLSILLSCGLAVAQADKKVEAPAAGTNEVAVIKTTEGEMVVGFWSDVAPKTVENFKKLAREGFYNGTAFHRVIKGFMIQGGDPNTKDPNKQADYGKGDPGYKIKAEFNDRPHELGVLSMARGPSPDSAGSQFFICLDRAEHLDHQYTAFGKLIKGQDVLTKIGNLPIKPNPYDFRHEPSWPVNRIGIESIKIVPADSIK
jgi:peptidyl-prolyl cis-trans isomerase B (cyclophilin B)